MFPTTKPVKRLDFNDLKLGQKVTLFISIPDDTKAEGVNARTLLQGTKVQARFLCLKRYSPEQIVGQFALDRPFKSINNPMATLVNPFEVSDYESNNFTSPHNGLAREAAANLGIPETAHLLWEVENNEEDETIVIPYTS
jgi:hypothetical protein